MALWIILAALVGLALGAFSGYKYRKDATEKQIGRTEEYAKNLLEEAQRRAEENKKEKILETKEEILKLKNELDKEIRDRRNEQQRNERRLAQREETIDKKLDNLELREDALDKKQTEINGLHKEAEDLVAKQQAEMERIGAMTQDEARQMLVSRIQKDAYHDAAVMVRDIEARTPRKRANKKARNIIALAIQKCAADHVAETTVSVVALPNEDMKGRIIGREGRNIRALETATGVDLIIDDTPEAVIVSAFDPVRREVARIALEKLIIDGRIHPARIEEMVEKAQKEVDQPDPARPANRPCSKPNLHGIHPELVKLLGRMRYRTSYGQNVLKHSIEVSHLAGVMAAELGADVQLAKRAGLLHDIGKAVDHEVEGTHVQHGRGTCAQVSRKPRRGQRHHGAPQRRGDPPRSRPCSFRRRTPSPPRVPARAASRWRTTSSAWKSSKRSANSFAGRGKVLRHPVRPRGAHHGQARGCQRRRYASSWPRRSPSASNSEMEYPGQIKVNVIRETRAVDFAK